MRLFLLALLTTALVSCDKKPPAIDREAALKWSQRSAVVSREKASTWTFQKADKSWVSISTARCKETDNGLIYEDAGILRSGFYVYPGANEVSTIEDALALASEIQGARYKPFGTK